jgi:uncharacterized protein
LYPKPYIDYLVYFHSQRDYFECHEVLEEHWKSVPKNERAIYWVGFIQLAVGLYHHRRNNFEGAKKMMNGAIRILEKEKRVITTLGLDFEELIKLMKTKLNDISHNEPFQHLDLPIVDENLLQVCIERCKEFNTKWKSDSADDFIIHKHSNRDRSDVIAARLEELEKKKNNRG